MPWRKARRLIPQQLGQLATIAHERGWPLLSAIVVTKENLESGKLDGTSLEGFLSAANIVGIKVDDPQAFVRDQQQKVFEWVAAAPAEIGVSSEDIGSSTAGPRFVQYFGPVLEALRELGGQARPEDVYSWVKENVEVPESEITGLNKGGQSKFENKVAWARFYLAKAGLIDGARRGVWALTSEGRETHLDQGSALALFRDIQARFKTADNDEEPAPERDIPDHELFDDPARQLWFVGAVWDGENQFDRFIQEGIWQNGYEEKFSEHVLRMRPGDRIAVKASFVQKYNLPFDNKGKPVSCMRIKAIGTITENPGDGRTVKVDWQRLDPPKDWFFYTYRVTVVEADPSDELARRLILFAFADADAKQDYNFWLKSVPYFAKRFGAGAETEDDDLAIRQHSCQPRPRVGSLPTIWRMRRGTWLRSALFQQVHLLLLVSCDACPSQIFIDG